MAEAHISAYRVYYEDTDMAGIVYYANYLKFLERGRSDAVRAAGIDQAQLRRDGLVFAVARVEIDYLSPARFDDILTVETRAAKVGGATLLMDQIARVDTRPAVRARVRVACMTPDGQVRRFPQEIRRRLGAIALD